MHDVPTNVDIWFEKVKQRKSFKNTFKQQPDYMLHKIKPKFDFKLLVPFFMLGFALLNYYLMPSTTIRANCLLEMDNASRFAGNLRFDQTNYNT